MEPVAAPHRILQIAAIAGSLREHSLNRALLRAAAALAPPTLFITIHDLLPIPLYNGDVESRGVPDSVAALRDAVRAADGLLIATPSTTTGCPESSRTRSTGCRGPLGRAP